MLTLRRYSDAIIGVIFLIIAGLYYKGSFLKTSVFMKAKYGPEFLPRIYCLLFVIFSILLIIHNIREVRKEKAEGQEKLIVNKNAIVRTIATILLVALYVSILSFIGFFIASALYMTAQLCILAPRNKLRPVRFFVFSVLVSILLDYIFVHFFFVKLPTGLLGF